MPKRSRFRDRAFVIAAVVVAAAYFGGLVVWLYQSHESSAGIERKAAANQQQRDYAILGCAGMTAIETFVCDLNAYAAESEANRSAYDLQAQQNSANAAFWMLVMGGIQALVGVGGIYFVASTLDETRKANEGADANARAAFRAARATSDTATATREANETTRVANHREMRPWIIVGIDSVHCTYDDANVVAHTSIRFSNIGRTPAIEVRVNARAYTLKGEHDFHAEVRAFVTDVLEPDLAVPKDVVVTQGNWEFIDPKPSIPFGETTVSDLEDVGEERRSFMVIIGATYQSLYEDRTFCSARAYIVSDDRKKDGSPLNRGPASRATKLPGGSLIT